MVIGTQKWVEPNGTKTATQQGAQSSSSYQSCEPSSTYIILVIYNFMKDTIKDKANGT